MSIGAHERIGDVCRTFEGCMIWICELCGTTGSTEEIAAEPCEHNHPPCDKCGEPAGVCDIGCPQDEGLRDLRPRF